MRLLCGQRISHAQHCSTKIPQLILHREEPIWYFPFLCYANFHNVIIRKEDLYISNILLYFFKEKAL